MRPLGTPECRWEDMDWISLAVGRHRWLAVVNMVMNFRLHRLQKIS
jgi:hypothetical protein